MLGYLGYLFLVLRQFLIAWIVWLWSVLLWFKAWNISVFNKRFDIVACNIIISKCIEWGLPVINVNHHAFFSVLLCKYHKYISWFYRGFRHVLFIIRRKCLVHIYNTEALQYDLSDTFTNFTFYAIFLYATAGLKWDRNLVRAMSSEVDEVMVTWLGFVPIKSMYQVS